MPLAKETSTKLTYICITAEKLLPLTSVNCANCQSSHQSSRRAFWIKKKGEKRAFVMPDSFISNKSAL